MIRRCVDTIHIWCFGLKGMLRSLGVHDHGNVLSLVIYFWGRKMVCVGIAGTDSSIDFSL